jgi:hypothetical protein
VSSTTLPVFSKYSEGMGLSAYTGWTTPPDLSNYPGERILPVGSGQDSTISQEKLIWLKFTRYTFYKFEFSNNIMYIKSSNFSVY